MGDRHAFLHSIGQRTADVPFGKGKVTNLVQAALSGARDGIVRLAWTSANETQKMTQKAKRMEADCSKRSRSSASVSSPWPVWHEFMPLLRKLNRKYDDEQRHYRGR